MTTNDFDKDKILARVRKMLNLANDPSAFEGERDNALRMAHATLAKYNLSLAEASNADASKGEKRIDTSHVDLGYPWARFAMHAVARMSFCMYFTRATYTANGNARSDVRRHYFVGRESNAITAKELATYVVRSIFAEANRRMRTERRDWSWHTSFCKGAASRVAARCEELRVAAEKANNGTQAPQASTGTAVVLASLYAQERKANEAYTAEHHGPLRTVVSRARAAGEGYHEGAAFGNSVSLSRQVGGSGHVSGKLK